MSFNTWKTETSRGLLTPRSTELKAIGTALQNYHANGRTRALLVELRQALDDWMGTKDDWQTSTRNRDGTVATLNDQVNQALGPGVRVTRGAIQRRRQQLTAPAPTRPPGTSLTTNALVRDFCDAIKDNVHTPWDTLTADERAGGMHQALADLFPRMNNMPAPGLALVADLGGAAGQFTFPAWNLTVASGPFAGAQPDRDTFLDMAKTIYHEGRHCEQWFHMARYAASGEQLSAAQLAGFLGIPQVVAADALTKRMDVRDPMFAVTKRWFESVYDRSGRGITLTALMLRRVGDPVLLSAMRTGNHQRYAGGLPEEADAWGTEALLDTVYVWP